MNYYEFVDRFAEESGRTKTESKEICDRMISIIMGTILNGEEISVYGFGKLAIKEYMTNGNTDFSGVYHPPRIKHKILFVPGDTFVRRLDEAMAERGGA